MPLPQFPPPDPRDPPNVAQTLRTAAALWNAGRHREALPHLLRAAPLAASAGVARERVTSLARAATDIAAFIESGDDPRSIPISLHFDVDSAVVEPEAVVVAPQAPPRARKGTMPEAFRAPPDTVRIAPAERPAPPSRRPDFTTTVPQGTRPPSQDNIETKRMQDIPTERAPSRRDKR